MKNTVKYVAFLLKYFDQITVFGNAPSITLQNSEQYFDT